MKGGMYEAPPQAVGCTPLAPVAGNEVVEYDPVVGFVAGVAITEAGFVDPPIPLPGRCAASVSFAMYL